MRLRQPRLLLCVATVALSSLSARAQLTVDATNPTHGGWENVTAGRGGGVGRKLPVQLAIEVQGTPFNAANGRTTLDFVFTNSGKGDLTVPISPHPEDIHSTGSYTTLAFYVTSDKRGEKMLQGGPDRHNPYIILFGSRSFPATLATLTPGNSNRVRTELAIPQTSAANPTATVFVAHAMMDDVTVTTVNGQPVSNSKEIGIAASSEYLWHDLLKTR